MPRLKPLRPTERTLECARRAGGWSGGQPCGGSQRPGRRTLVRSTGHPLMALSSPARLATTNAANHPHRRRLAARWPVMASTSNATNVASTAPWNTVIRCALDQHARPGSLLDLGGGDQVVKKAMRTRSRPRSLAPRECTSRRSWGRDRERADRIRAVRPLRSYLSPSKIARAACSLASRPAALRQAGPQKRRLTRSASGMAAPQ